jgi:hypothetical protein
MKARLLWLLAALATSGCRNELRFDERDGGVDGGSPDAQVGTFSCVDPGCGWKKGECTPGGCGIECERQRTCTAGLCGDGCHAECEAGSDCTLASSAGSIIGCESALCTLTVGRGSTVFCAATSSCAVQCLGDCTLSCSSSSLCTLRCQGETAGRPVRETTRCP